MKRVTKILLYSISGILVVVCVLLRISVDYYTDKLTVIEESIKIAEKSLNDVYNNWRVYSDSNYKLFYGEWVVCSIVTENSTCGADSNAEDLVGMTYYYDSGTIREGAMSSINDGDSIIARPEYHYYIVPNESNYCILENFASPKELGIEGEYVVFISVYSQDIPSTFLGGNFYIKDNNTLLLYANNAIYEMHRVRYYDEPEYRYW